MALKVCGKKNVRTYRRSNHEWRANRHRQHWKQ